MPGKRESCVRQLKTILEAVDGVANVWRPHRSADEVADSERPAYSLSPPRLDRVIVAEMTGRRIREFIVSVFAYSARGPSRDDGTMQDNIETMLTDAATAVRNDLTLGGNAIVCLVADVDAVDNLHNTDTSGLGRIDFRVRYETGVSGL